MTNRDSAAEEYVLWAPEITSVRDVRIARAAYTAGWNARKQAELEIAYGLKLLALPLHASAYEPLTPFKPHPHNSTEEAIVARIKDPPLGDAHVGGSPPPVKQFTGRKFTVVHGGDQVHGKVHDG